MSEQFIDKFLRASTRERLNMITSSDAAEDLKKYLGAEAFDEYRRMAEKALPKFRKKLGVDSPPNLIFVPGVMGSLLASKSKGGVWWIDILNRSYIDKLALNEDGTKDADSANTIYPFTTHITYEPFYLAVLERKDFGHVIFPYDWRKSLVHSAQALKDLVLSTYASNGNNPVHLVGHSMGGVMIRTMLMLYGEQVWKVIGRIAFIGTPHYGSPAIASYLKNHLWGWDYRALLGRYISRETFRTLRGVINLLPAPSGIYPGTRNGESSHPCANFDMYDAKAWELGLTNEQNNHLQSVLDEAREFHRQLFDAHLTLNQKWRDKMLVIAGVGIKTLFKFEFNSGLWGMIDPTDKVTSRIPGDPNREGDSTVPLASAQLENVGDVRYIKGDHGNLPMIPAVYEGVFRWFSGKSLELPSQVNGALTSKMSGGNFKVNAPTLTMPPVPIDPETNEPDFWDVQVQNGILEQAERLDQMEWQLAQGQLPDFIKVKIL
jgi:pimeloyl-ACP methyl ester carboxylesterase